MGQIADGEATLARLGLVSGGVVNEVRIAQTFAAAMVAADGCIDADELFFAARLGADTFAGFDAAAFEAQCRAVSELPSVERLAADLARMLEGDQKSRLFGFLFAICQMDGEIALEEVELLRRVSQALDLDFDPTASPSIGTSEAAAAPHSAVDPGAVAAAAAEMEFRTLAEFGAGEIGVFRSSAGGPSPWEMHPDCDEMLQILVGAIEVEILPPDGAGALTPVGAGEIIVIPRGLWHRQTLLAPTTELYVTPGATQHSHAADPRPVDAAD